MGFEVRMFRESELEQAWELDRQAFNSHPSRREVFLAHCRGGALYGAFENGRAAAMLNVHPMVHNFGGHFLAAGGVSSVVVAPEFRGQGLASRVLRASLGGMREAGNALSSLYPANLRLYRRVGWELAGSYAIRQIHSRHLLLLERPEPGRVRRAERDDLPAIRESYRRVALGVPGMHDGEMRWLDLEREFEKYFVYCAEGVGGSVSGALVFEQIPNPEAGQFRIRVHRVFAEDRLSTEALWWLVGTSSSQAGEVYYPAPPEDPLALLLPEPRHTTRYAGQWMLRVIDVEKAISDRGFGGGVEAEVDFALEDADLPENSGAFRLSVSQGKGRIERIGSARLRVGIGAFSSWYSGWADSTTLFRAGLVEEPGYEGALLDACFAGRTPWMMDEF